jgi:hypothetical protein
MPADPSLSADYRPKRWLRSVEVFMREWGMGAGLWLMFCAIAIGLAPPDSPEQPWVWWWPYLMVGPLAPVAVAAVVWVLLAVLVLGRKVLTHAR